MPETLKQHSFPGVCLKLIYLFDSHHLTNSGHPWRPSCLTMPAPIPARHPGQRQEVHLCRDWEIILSDHQIILVPSSHALMFSTAELPIGTLDYHPYRAKRSSRKELHPLSALSEASWRRRREGNTFIQPSILWCVHNTTLLSLTRSRQLPPFPPFP